jgi:hypothetical protein
VEEARTNLVQQSADISNAYWVKAETTVTANAIAAPDGTMTAGKLIESTANSQHTLASASIAWAGNTQYTFTFYAKAGERSKFDLLFGTAGNWVNSERTIGFDLGTGTLLTAPNSPLLASITPAGNGWYRCRMTATTVASPAASAAFIRMYDNANLSSYTGTAGYGLYFWGAQLEAGAFPSSYIATTTAAATRAADVVSITGSAFSSWYSQSGWTLFSDSSIIASQIKTQIVWELGGGSYASSLRQPQSTSNQFRALVAGVFSTAPGTGANLTTGVSQAAVAFSDLTGRLQVGTAGVDITVTNTPDPNALSIGSSGGSTQLNGTIRRLVFWPQALPSRLQAITQ